MTNGLYIPRGMTEEDIVSDYMASREEFDNYPNKRFSSATEVIDQIHESVEEIKEALTWLESQIGYGYTFGDGEVAAHIQSFRNHLEGLMDIHMPAIGHLED